MADVEQKQKMLPFITSEISICQYVCELVFGVNVFDLDLGVQIDSIEWPIKSNSVSPGNMSHCWTPSFNDHLDHRFVVLKHIQQSFLMRRFNIIQISDHSLRIACVCESCEVENKLHVCSFSSRRVLYGSDSCFQELQRSDPISQEREYHPTSVQRPKR